eukprot:gene1020-1106_t
MRSLLANPLCPLLLLVLSLLLLCLPIDAFRTLSSITSNNHRIGRLHDLRLEISKGFMPKPKVLEPSQGTKKISIDKFLMMYTCKLCSGRNAQMVSKVAYEKGMVISTCRHCKKLHLIADNEGKLDMATYGPKIEDYLASRGEKVQRMTLSAEELEDNYLVDRDGQLSLVPKMAGQVPSDATIVNLPTASSE